MKKLFIIGNGFDVAHKLPTQYKDFRKFLNELCGGELSYMPSISVDQDGDYSADRETTAGLLINLIDNTLGENDWKDVEYAMGIFNYDEYFDDFDLSAAIADSDDNEMYRVQHVREEIASNLHCCIYEIKNLFAEWIDTIEVDAEPQSRFVYLFDADSLFLTFNYTNTLEAVYDIKDLKVCHIHGEQGGEIIVGHGNDDNPYSEEKFDYIGIQDSLEDLFESLKKDVVGCFYANSKFFNQIKDYKITDIYSFGFSFSDIDLYYITQICKIVDTSSVTWHLSEYDEGDKNEKYKKLLIECGFKGRFGELIPN